MILSCYFRFVDDVDVVSAFCCSLQQRRVPGVKCILEIMKVHSRFRPSPS